MFHRKRTHFGHLDNISTINVFGVEMDPVKMESERSISLLQDAYLPRLLGEEMFVHKYVEMAQVTGVPISFLVSRGQSIEELALLIPNVKMAGPTPGTYQRATCFFVSAESKDASDDDGSEDAYKDDASKNEAYEDGSTDASDDDGSEAETDEDRSEDETDEDGSEDASDDDGSEDEIDEDGSKDASDDDGSEDEIDEDGSKDASDDDESEDETDEDGSDDASADDSNEDAADEDGSDDASDDDSSEDAADHVDNTAPKGLECHCKSCHKKEVKRKIQCRGCKAYFKSHDAYNDHKLRKGQRRCPYVRVETPKQQKLRFEKEKQLAEKEDEHTKHTGPKKKLF